MTQARNSAKNWFRQNGTLLFPILAFAIPLIVRAIPEILMGQYLVGFDTMGYYVPNTLTWLGNGVNFWALMSSAPLLYILLMGITSAGSPNRYYTQNLRSFDSRSSRICYLLLRQQSLIMVIQKEPACGNPLHIVFCSVKNIMGYVSKRTCINISVFSANNSSKKWAQH